MIKTSKYENIEFQKEIHMHQQNLSVTQIFENTVGIKFSTQKYFLYTTTASDCMRTLSQRI